MRTDITSSSVLIVAAVVAINSLTTSHGQLAQSTFSANADGWSVVDRVTNGLEITNTRPVSWQTPNGNPGGFITTADADGDFYFRAPGKFLGNQSAAYGYPLQFDLTSNLQDTPGQLKYSVILIGGGITNVVSLPPITTPNMWTHYSVMLQAGAQWTNIWTGLPSAEADLRTCLASLQSLDIAGEFGTGPDTGGLDNVVLHGPYTTVFWDRKALGQEYLTCAGPPPTVYYWPSNNYWSQYEHYGSDCFNHPNTVTNQPSNWTTTNYPNNPNCDVVLGDSGGGPTLLDISPTVHSLTIRPEGGLEMMKDTTITANVFDFQGDGEIGRNVGVVGVGCLNIVNGGSVTKSGGTGTSLVHAYLIGSGATIDVNSGTLTFVGGTGENCWTNFTFNVASNATLSFPVLGQSSAYQSLFWAGNFTAADSGAILMDSGTIEMKSGTCLNFPEPVFQWTGGYLMGWGGASWTNSGTINVAGLGQKSLGPTLFNAGRLKVIGSGALNFRDSTGLYCTLNNIAGGLIEVQSDAAFTSVGTINNWGLLRKSAGTGTNVISPNFNSQNGTIEVGSGGLSLISGGTSSNGTFIVGPGSTLDLSLPSQTWMTYQGSFTGSGGGHILFNSGTLRAGPTGLTLNFPDQMLQWAGGFLQNNSYPLTNRGAIRAAGTDTKVIDGVLNNAGALMVTGSGPISVHGGAIYNLAGGTVDYQVDAEMTSLNGSIYNSGLLRKSGGAGTSLLWPTFYNQNGAVEVDSGILQLASGNYQQGGGALTIALGGRGAGQSGKLAVNSSATLAGPLNVVLANGFIPAMGDQFQILSCGSRNGTFSTLNLPAGLSVSYANNGVFLSVTAAAPTRIVGPTLASNVFGFWFCTLDGTNYCVERNDDLSTTNWIGCTNCTGNGSWMQFVTPATNVNKRFFRVR